MKEKIKCDSEKAKASCVAAGVEKCGCPSTCPHNTAKKPETKGRAKK